MNKNTLDRLKNNPHYKMSPQQRAELEEEERPKMIEFGEPEFHDQSFDIQYPNQQRKKRTKRPVTEEEPESYGKTPEQNTD